MLAKFVWPFLKSPPLQRALVADPESDSATPSLATPLKSAEFLFCPMVGQWVRDPQDGTKITSQSDQSSISPGGGWGGGGDWCTLIGA